MKALLGFMASLGVLAGLVGFLLAGMADRLDSLLRISASDLPLRALLLGLFVTTVLGVLLSGAQRLLRRTKAQGEEIQPLVAAGLESQLSVLAERLAWHLKGKEPNAVAALDEIFSACEITGASDAHLSPGGVSAELTLRVNGELKVVAEIDTGAFSLLVNRVKVLSQLQLEVKQVAQDGRLSRLVCGRVIEARVSTLPTEFGERIVLRIVRSGQALAGLAQLGFSDQVLTGLSSLLRRPQGLLIVTGPVGSGKTATLYSSLSHIFEARGQNTSMVSLEDPVEQQLGFVTQTSINARAGMGFAETLRSVLRQDPNVLMIGEIRDRETAEIAVQAGLTGHLLLTTVHANSAAAAFTRLLELNIESFALASAGIGALSQRLVRTLCTACRRAEQPDAATRSQFAELSAALPIATYYAAVGCELCQNEGYLGRTALAELLVVGDEIREAIGRCATAGELTRCASASGMTRLVEEAVAKAASGETTLAEVLRVAG